MMSVLPLVRRFQCVLLAALLFAIPALATPDQWAAEIDQLTAADKFTTPMAEAVVFVGSSSIRYWTTLAEDFPGIRTINRGFGGSELADSVFYAGRIVIPYHPRLVVVYAGDNDLWAGKTPAVVLADFQAFRAQVQAALPATKNIFLAIKESASGSASRSGRRTNSSRPTAPQTGAAPSSTSPRRCSTPPAASAPSCSARTSCT